MAQQGFGGDGSGDTGVHHVSPNTNVAASNATAPMSEGGYNNSSCSDKPASAGGIATRTTINNPGRTPQPPVEAANRDHALMKITLLAQRKKIQDLMAKVEGLEAEKESMRQQVDTLRMAVFEASTSLDQTAQQYKRDAVEAAVREIAHHRQSFVEGRREAIARIEELEDALKIALKASLGVHRQLLDLGLSCGDLAKSNLHLSVAAQDAPAEDQPALALAGKAIEAVVGVMRSMEGSGVFDLLAPVVGEDGGHGPDQNDTTQKRHQEGAVQEEGLVDTDTSAASVSAPVAVSAQGTSPSSADRSGPSTVVPLVVDNDEKHASKKPVEGPSSLRPPSSSSSLPAPAVSVPAVVGSMQVVLENDGRGKGGSTDYDSREVGGGLEDDVGGGGGNDDNDDDIAVAIGGTVCKTG